MPRQISAPPLLSTMANQSAPHQPPSAACFCRNKHYPLLSSLRPALRLPLPRKRISRLRVCEGLSISRLPLASKTHVRFNLFRFALASKVDGSSHFSSPDQFLWLKPFLDFARNNFLPLALVSAIILGLATPSLGHLAERYPLSKFSTVGIFFISGLMLRSEEIGAAREAWFSVIIGLTSILLFTPFFARAIMQASLNPPEFVTGLGIFCCMPTTLSSGVALTQLVGGNSALALAMTVLSNFLGILTVPFSLSNFVGGARFGIPTMQLFKSLVVSLLVPLALGKVLRDALKSVAIFVDQNSKYVSMISAVLLSLVSGTQVSRSKPLLLTVRPEVFAIAVSLGILLHITLLAFNASGVQVLSMLSGGKESVLAKKENARAVIIVASQKTLPVTVAVVEQLAGALGEPGLLILPCVAAHINQIIIDSVLVNWWLSRDQPE